jgi:proline dehydrogenase
MIHHVCKAFFYALADSPRLKQLASRYGARRHGHPVHRLIAGETAGDAIEAARHLAADGRLSTLRLVGGPVTTMAEADAATRAQLGFMDEIAAGGIQRNISLTLTGLGLTVDRATAVDNLRRVLDGAGAHDFFVRVDMEGSSFTHVTHGIFETMWQQGYRNVGITVQSALPRSRADVERLNGLGARVRLVKGAYTETKGVAYQDPRQVDAAFVELMQELLAGGTYPAIATHDPAMIDATRAFAASRGIAADRFEFQMLYGVGGSRQLALVSDGFRVRVYVPCGREWFPYLMRQMGDKTANIGFVIRAIVGKV